MNTFYNDRTEQTCLGWGKQFLHFHCMRHPREMGEVQVAGCLAWLAVGRLTELSSFGASTTKTRPNPSAAARSEPCAEHGIQGKSRSAFAHPPSSAALVGHVVKLRGNRQSTDWIVALIDESGVDEGMQAN